MTALLEIMTVLYIAYKIKRGGLIFTEAYLHYCNHITSWVCFCGEGVFTYLVYLVFCCYVVV